MKYYVPRFELGVLSNSQRLMEDKFGGLPWGIPARFWPICRSCGKSMSLIVQLNHHDERLNLGRKGRCLFVFMCSNPDSYCEPTWNSSEGCNSSFVVEPEALENNLSFPPDVAEPETAQIRNCENCAYDQSWVADRTIWIQTEVRISKWIQMHDEIPKSDRSNFTDETKYSETSEELLKSIYSGTKLGSVPSWIQSPEYSDWTFVAQFDDYFGFHTPLPEPDDIGCPVGQGDRYNYQRFLPKTQRLDSPREVTQNENRSTNDDPRWFCEGPNFGDAGSGYLFIKFDGELLPKSEFIWQCH